MSAIIVRPLPFTVGSNTGWAAITPVSNTNLDHPGLVARSTGNTASFTVNLGSTQTIDCVALIGSNLPSTATVSVTAPGYAGLTGNVAAYTGVKDASVSTKTIIQFPAISVSSVTITITSNAPIEFQRTVIGKKIEAGIDQSTEHFLEDQSVIENGPGYTTVEEHAVLNGWKVKMSWITTAKWEGELFPFFNRVGVNKAFLFVPIADEPDRFQSQAVFGRANTPAKGEHQTGRYVVSFSVVSLAP